MSSATGKVLIAGCVLTTLGGLGALLLGGGGGAEVTDTGSFRVGSAVGDERASFSGRPKVQVFVDTTKDQTPLYDCLASAAVEGEMGAFVGVLVDVSAEPSVEADLREKAGLQVVVRDLQGRFLGGVPGVFGCEELASLLREVRRRVRVRPSPAYAQLVRSPDLVDELLAAGRRAEAERLVALLRDFEGETEAVLAAEARLSE